MKPFDARLQGLQVFAGLEPHCLSGRDVHFGTCSRISPDPSLAGLYRKHPKAAQLNPIVSFQGIFHAVEDGIHGLFRLRLANTRALDDLIDEVEFDH